jgi:hypothetical protein
MHDRNGQALKEGDLVSVLFKIKSVGPDQDFCNCTLETVDPMPGNGSQSTLVLNAKQTTLVTRERGSTT